jgi:hypothetical protein
VTQAVQTAASDIQIGDQAYQLFLRTMPSNVGVTMPNSVWLTTPGQYQPQTTRVFLDSLQSVMQTQPVHQVEIYSLTTSPAPVARSGDVLVLPDAVEISVTMVLADTGNQAENGLTVTASLSYAGNGPSSAQDVVDLSPGQAQSIVGLGPIAPPQGRPVTLYIQVKPPAGSLMSPIDQSLVLEMPASVGTNATTTTTPTNSSSTTNPGTNANSTSTTSNSSRTTSGAGGRSGGSGG